jgi:activator of HSP90 ATPase
MLYVPFVELKCCRRNTDPMDTQFEIDIYSETKEKQAVKDLVRSKIVPQLRDALGKLGPALITEHAKDIQHAANSNPSSGVATPTWHPQRDRTSTAVGAQSTTTNTAQSSVNTATVTATDEFRTTAEEMFQTFTDPQRIAAFTRGKPQIFEGAKPGGKFSIFDGNVTGEFTILEPGKRIVQKWRLAQWPEGHMSSQEIVFDQNDMDKVTNARVTWSGVPVGQEEVVKRNWEGYYIRSIKQTFGYVFLASLPQWTLAYCPSVLAHFSEPPTIGNASLGCIGVGFVSSSSSKKRTLSCPVKIPGRFLG